ncbi:MAG: S9 family peptidase [Armatimonadota bacterium]|nr:S9 family peptidase [Armatimonadota bacterium]MDR7403459.1 S9 family peptidase [Armatimonadota bacterium]
MPTVAPYGTWKSPITAELVAGAGIVLSEIAVDGPDVYWSELRPAERGRKVIVRRPPDGRTADVLPPPFNARTTVHEYGGGDFVVDRGVVYFSEYADQRLYRLQPGGTPDPLTLPGALRYADAVVDRQRRRLICVCEDHARGDQEAENYLAAVPLEGGRPQVLVRGADFYASPRLSPDGAVLAWLSWDRPNMPWDGTTLWVAAVRADGTVEEPHRVAGGPEESVFQPEWSPDGILYFVSDRTGWWNLYRWDARAGRVEPVVLREAEFGRPQWVFRMSTYGLLDPSTAVCAFIAGGVWRLALLDTRRKSLDVVDLPYTEISQVTPAGTAVYFIGGSPTEPLALVRLDVRRRAVEVLRTSRPHPVDPGYISVPQAIAFPTTGGQAAYGWYYPPTNADFAGPPGERPPLLVVAHGGPTSFSPAVLRLEFQYWTSRGFAVVDVNYGGSTGYGRAYRNRLRGQWGVVDVDDCVHAARFLVDRGLADGMRVAIRGGSAGGYTTLCALAFRDAFRAGASHFGVSDLEALHRETHKFESRYDYHLVGPYPERADLFRARSPIHYAHQIRVPVIFFQGLEDRVVPPSQSEAMVEALRRRGIPVAYLAFEGEQHGFRRAETIRRVLEAELYFYGRIFGFSPADTLDPVPIHNLD